MRYASFRYLAVLMFLSRSIRPTAFFLFFYWYGDLRDLHSFPTRRSSDQRGPSCVVVRIAHAHAVERVLQARQMLRRSEEHTSELQSREKLVCRLLLEKKNRLEREPTTTRSRL